MRGCLEGVQDVQCTLLTLQQHDVWAVNAQDHDQCRRAFEVGEADVLACHRIRELRAQQDTGKVSVCFSASLAVWRSVNETPSICVCVSRAYAVWRAVEWTDTRGLCVCLSRDLLTVNGGACIPTSSSALCVFTLQTCRGWRILPDVRAVKGTRLRARAKVLEKVLWRVSSIFLTMSLD